MCVVFLRGCSYLYLCAHRGERRVLGVLLCLSLFRTGSVTEIEQSWQTANPTDLTVCPNSTGWQDTHSHASFFHMGGQFRSDPWACRANIISSCSLRDPSCQLLRLHRRDSEVSELFYFVFKITEIQMTTFSLTIFRNFLPYWHS